MSVVITVGRNRETPLITSGDPEGVRVSVDTIAVKAGANIFNFKLSLAESLLVKELKMPADIASQLSTAVARRQVGTSVTFDASLTSGENPPSFSNFKYTRPTPLQRLVHRVI